MDDRLWEDGSPARAEHPGPQDSLGGGQQRGRLPVGTGQPYRHFEQYAPKDTLRRGGSEDCNEKTDPCPHGGRDTRSEFGEKERLTDEGMEESVSLSTCACGRRGGKASTGFLLLHGIC